MYSLTGKVVIADEIQILSDQSRGPDIEVLCSIIRQQRPKQFIALSATAPNVQELADWFRCKCIDVRTRDVPLRQEVWYGGHCYHAYFGDEDVYENTNERMPSDTLSAVRLLLEKELGPVLVFTMTKPKATKLAEQFAARRQQDTASYSLGEQLELFSEPTTLARTLKNVSERKVAFHSADLSFSERGVVERGLRDRAIDVVFATPTLAAGVNFPIRTVVFDSYQRWWMDDPWLSKEDYVNMSGRAGRLGMHEEGTSVLLSGNRVELDRAKKYLSSEQTPVYSVLMSNSD